MFWLAGIEQLWLVHFKDVFPQKVAGAQLSYCCRVFWLLTTMLVGFYSTVPFHNIKVVIFYGERNLSSMTWLRTVELKFHKHQSQQSRNTTKSELCHSKDAHLVMNQYSWAQYLIKRCISSQPYSLKLLTISNQKVVIIISTTMIVSLSKISVHASAQSTIVVFQGNEAKAKF